MPFSQQIKRILECSLQLKVFSIFQGKKYKNIKELKTYNPWNILDMIL